MVTRSKPKPRGRAKLPPVLHPNRPTVEQLMAMSQDEFRAWIREIGFEEKIQRALKELDAGL